MSDKLLESMSALMDNETDELELRRLLKAMEADDRLVNTWSRYHVAKAVLHKELTVSPAIDLTARVSAALEEEQAHRERTFSLPKMAAVAAVAMFSVLLTAKLVVNQSSDASLLSNEMASTTGLMNSNIQRAGYIVGQPNNAAPSLYAQKRVQNNDVQRVELISLPQGYIVLPAADTDPAQ